MSEQEIKIRIIKILANNADEPQNTVDAIYKLILQEKLEQYRLGYNDCLKLTLKQINQPKINHEKRK